MTPKLVAAQALSAAAYRRKRSVVTEDFQLLEDGYLGPGLGVFGQDASAVAPYCVDKTKPQ